MNFYSIISSSVKESSRYRQILYREKYELKKSLRHHQIAGTSLKLSTTKFEFEKIQMARVMTSGKVKS